MNYYLRQKYRGAFIYWNNENKKWWTEPHEGLTLDKNTGDIIIGKLRDNKSNMFLTFELIHEDDLLIEEIIK